MLLKDYLHSSLVRSYSRPAFRADVILASWARDVLQDNVGENVVYYLGGNIDQQNLARNHDALVAVSWRRQMPKQICWQCLFRNAWRQRLASSQVLGDTWRQGLGTLLAM